MMEYASGKGSRDAQFFTKRRTSSRLDFQYRRTERKRKESSVVMKAEYLSITKEKKESKKVTKCG